MEAADIGKLTRDLKDLAEQVAPSEHVDVVVELSPGSAPEPSRKLSRQERVSFLKEMFSRDAGPVEEIIEKTGGQVTGRAWINQTLRATVPAEALKQLSKLEQVGSLDVPHRLESDASG